MRLQVTSTLLVQFYGGVGIRDGGAGRRWRQQRWRRRRRQRGWAVTHPNPSLLSLVSREEAGRSTLMAAKAIGIHEAIETVPPKNDQQWNAGGACIFLADDLINGGLAEMEVKEEAEYNAAGMEDLSISHVNDNISNRHSCHSPCLVGVSADVPLMMGVLQICFLKTWLMPMMSQKQELLLQESGGLKANKPAKNLDAMAEGAVTGRPSPPQISPKLETFFFLRPNRFHQSLLAYLTTSNSSALRRFLPLLMV
jgi:hypothetical protein